MEGFEALSLPSKGKPYKDFDPANVTIRPLIGKDEMVLAEISRDNVEKKFNVLIENVTTGLDPKKLTLGDRRYILVWLAMKTYGSKFPVELVCDNCLLNISTEIDMSTFNLKELPDNFEHPYPLKLSDDRILYLRLMTVTDEINASDYEKRFGNAWIFRFAQVIVDQEKTLPEKVRLLENLPGREFQLVKAFHEKFDHGPEMEAPYECPKCGGEGRVSVPFRIEHLLPHGKTLERGYADKV